MQTQNRFARNTLYRPFPGDENLHVQFETVEDQKDEKASLEKGYPVYAPVDMIKIHIPGSSLTTIVAPVDSPVTMPDSEIVTYAERFPDDYERFKAGKTAAVSGTPLKHLPFLSRGEVEALARSNVYTVETLADLGGAAMKAVGQNGRRWQQQAKAFLESAAGNRDAAAASARIAELEAQLEAIMAHTGMKPAEVAVEQEDDEQTRKASLKDEIEALTGVRPRGNPSVESLEAQLAEARG